MILHDDPHPLAGQTVTIRERVTDLVDHRGMVVAGAEYRVEDYWDRVSGTSWQEVSDCNPAAMQYAMRIGLNGSVPADDEVLYGKINGIGHLVHVTEIDGAA